MSDFYKDCFTLMNAYAKMKVITKRSMCELIIPFRDKYHLKDLQAIMIARNQVDAGEILKLGQFIESEM